MTNSTRSNRTLADLTVRELATLRLLNERLAQSELWILERGLASLMRSHAKTAPAHGTEDLDEVKVQAKVFCIARDAHVGSTKARDEIVAQLDCSMTPGHVETTGERVAGQRGETGLNPLRDMPACRLFLDLRDVYLQGDWERMLAINTIRVEFSVLLRRSEEVWMSLTRDTASRYPRRSLATAARLQDRR